MASPEEVKEVFAKYDANGDGKIQEEELVNVLTRLAGMRVDQAKKLFRAIDKDGSADIDYAEFVDWLYKPAKDPKAKAAVASGGYMTVERIFYNFCGIGTDMDNKSFVKLCKDCGLVSRGGLSTTDLDLMFTKVCPKGQRRINYEGFQRLLSMMADQMGSSVVELETKLRTSAGAGGPVLSGTQADDVRFHDDKSTYTGAHTQNDNHRGAGARPAAVAQRTSASPAPGPQRASQSPQRTSPRTASPAAKARSPSPGPEASPKSEILRARASQMGAALDRMDHVPQHVQAKAPSTLEGIFKSFCGGKEDLDGKSFVKLSKDSGLIGKGFTTTDADLIFAKACRRGARKLSFHGFQEALHLVADKLGAEPSTIEEKIARSGGPVLSGTQAEAVRFHDDKSTYTGAHARDGRHT